LVSRQEAACAGEMLYSLLQQATTSHVIDCTTASAEQPDDHC
jgi:hypothetical protein